MKKSVSYGWLIVAASTLMLTGFYGTQMTFGVFLKPLIDEFHWTRTMLSGAMSTLAGIYGPTGIITGQLTDRYGAQRIVAFGALLGAAGYFLLSQASSLWQFYVFFGVFMGLCQATCWTPLIATASKWFSDKRVLAIGIVTSGLTIGNMVFPPVAAWLITLYDWSFTYILMAIILVVLALPAIVLLGRKPPESEEVLPEKSNIEQTRTDNSYNSPEPWTGTVLQAAISVPFLMLSVIGVVTAAGFYFLATHIVAYATDSGMAVTWAALIFTVMGASNITGKLVIWRIVKPLGSRLTLFLLLILQATALFLLISSSNPWVFFVSGAMFGLGLGSTIPVRMAMVAELYGTRKVGVLLGILGISWAAGGVAGPVLAGYVFDISQSYNIAFTAGGILMILGMVATFFLKPTIRNR